MDNVGNVYRGGMSGKELRAMRHEANVPAERIAVELGVTLKTVYTWEQAEEVKPHQRYAYERVIADWSARKSPHPSAQEKWFGRPRAASSQHRHTPSLMLSAEVAAFVVSRRHTAASRRSALYTLTHFTAAVGDPPPDRLDPTMVLDWWSGLDRLSPSSRRQRYSTVRAFLAWLRERDLLAAHDPLVLVRPPREPRRSPQVLSAPEVDALRAHCESTRDRLIVELAWGIGLRCIEIARLQVADVDLDAQLVEVWGKGGHRDVLPIPCPTADAIEAYLREFPPPAAGALVRDARWHRHPISAQRVSEVVASLARTAGVKRGRWDGRGAHGLRRTCATELLDSGATIRQVQAVLRHQSLRTTEAYLRRSTLPELREALDRRMAN